MVGAIGAVLLATVVAALIAIAHAENHSSAGRLAATIGPAPGGPSTKVTASTAATTGGAINGGAVSTPTPTPTPTAPAPGPASTPAPPLPQPADPMLALRQSIQRQSDIGGLKPDAVRDLNHAVDDLAKSITSANPDDETKKLKALRDKLTSLYREGKLTGAGYSEISSRVDAVAATIG